MRQTVTVGELKKMLDGYCDDLLIYQEVMIPRDILEAIPESVGPVFIVEAFDSIMKTNDGYLKILFSKNYAAPKSHCGFGPGSIGVDG